MDDEMNEVQTKSEGLIVKAMDAAGLECTERSIHEDADGEPCLELVFRTVEGFSFDPEDVYEFASDAVRYEGLNAPAFIDLSTPDDGGGEEFILHLFKVDPDECGLPFTQKVWT